MVGGGGGGGGGAEWLLDHGSDGAASGVLYFYRWCSPEGSITTEISYTSSRNHEVML